jgi:hypothetical protein
VKACCFASSRYDALAFQWDQTLWLVDVEQAATLDAAALEAHMHLTPLVRGSQQAFASCSSTCHISYNYQPSAPPALLTGMRDYPCRGAVVSEATKGHAESALASG